MHLVDTIIAFGYIGVTLTVFAESGFLFGFFLPGDSLLFTVGLFASQGYFNIFVLTILLIPAAILGDNLGYATGRSLGTRLFSRNDSMFFKKSHIAKAQEFFAKHGPRAIILARFVPIVRTFTPIVAGAARMHYPTFMKFNVIGGTLWVVSFLYASYFLGRVIPGIENYLTYIVIGIILISIIPIAKPVLSSMLKKRGGAIDEN